MRLFWEDQKSLVMVYIIQMIITPMIFWLDGDRQLSLTLYSLLLSTVFLLLYLLYQYLQKKKLYDLCTQGIQEVENSYLQLGHHPLVQAISNLLTQQAQLSTQQVEEAKSKVQNQLTFINQWVHQMKTPISIIQLSIQDYDDLPIISSIQEEVDRLQKGLEMVLSTARIHHFEQDFVVRSHSLRELMLQSISSNKRLFIRKQIIPEIDISSDLCVYTDSKWMTFVLDQLITNAVRYTHQSRSKISLSVHLQGNLIILRIQDYGIGITSEDLPRVFDSYFTGKQGREYRESTGMGLYLVKQICQKLGHAVEIQSTVGKGTIVEISFLHPSSSNLTLM